MKSIVRISGGIGNQFFQLAFGDYLKNSLSHQISFDVSFYTCSTTSCSDTRRDFVGHVLDPVEVYLDFDLFRIESKFQTLIVTGRNKIHKKVLSFCFLVRVVISHRFILHFKPEISTLWNILGDSVTHVFIGSWQDISYVREEFRIKIFKNLRDKVICKFPHPLSNYLGMHVRRGDYLNSNSIHTVLDVSYYRRAISIFSKDILDPILLVFTDDIQWCKSNLHLDFPMIFANAVVDSDLGELALMAQLNYLVIGNSSFSFTGALLGISNKKVIAPATWYSSSSHQKSIDIPDTWVSI